MYYSSSNSTVYLVHFQVCDKTNLHDLHLLSYLHLCCCHDQHLY